jgi:hypothetical protein
MLHLFCLTFFCKLLFSCSSIMETDSFAVVVLCQNLGLVDFSKVSRPLPWRPPTNSKRTKEDVRPIFWCVSVCYLVVLYFCRV